MNTEDAEKNQTSDQETREIQRISFYGFLLNLALAVMKGVLASLSGSLAITASTIDSATDSVASLVLYVGLKLSAQKTPKFPLGLYKIENLLSVAMAFFIFLAGYEIALRAFSEAAAPPHISLTIILLILVGTVSIVFFGRYALAAGRRTESPTLIAEGRHRQADALSSVVVLVSVIINYFNLEMDFYGITVDQIAAVLVLLFIAHTGWELLSDGMRVLLDASIDHETLAEVRRIIEAEPQVAEVQSLVGRNAGRFRFLQATVVMRTDQLQKAHKISENIKADIRKSVPHVERVVIHYEPRSREYLRIAVPLSDSEGKVSPHFGSAPFFAVILLRLKDNQVEKQEIIRNPHTQIKEAKGIRVAEWLVSQKVDEVAMTEDLKHKGPGYVFSDAGVEIHGISEQDLEDVIASVRARNHSESSSNRSS